MRLRHPLPLSSLSVGCFVLLGSSAPLKTSRRLWTPPSIQAQCVFVFVCVYICVCESKYHSRTPESFVMFLMWNLFLQVMKRELWEEAVSPPNTLSAATFFFSRFNFSGHMAETLLLLLPLFLLFLPPLPPPPSAHFPLPSVHTYSVTDGVTMVMINANH